MRQIACMLLVSLSPLFAQTDRGAITGTIFDPSGAPVAGAQVRITNPATNATVTLSTTDSGQYSAQSLALGRYRVEVQSSGFKRAIFDDVVVDAGSTLRIDAQLQLGQLSETVEVQASAAQVQTENAKVSTVVQQKLVEDLPLVVGGAMRSPFNLVNIAAEAKGTGQSLSIGGGQAAAWNATLDGYSIGTNRSGDTAEAALNAPSVESLTEFTVDTNGFKAEFSQAGGGVLTFVSKSGTNQLHGTAYDFLRNDKMDARGFFAATRAIYKQNDFGGSLGGPVVFPKLYRGKDRTFFFLAYEGFRNRVGATSQFNSVPTPEMYGGDFSKLVDATNKPLLIYDPATTRSNGSGGFIRDPFAGNIIPTNRFAAVAKSILPYGQTVKPNTASAIPGTAGYIRNNYLVSSGTNTTPTDKWSAKIDEMLSSRQRLSFLYNGTRYRGEPGASGPPGLPIPLYNGQITAWDTKAYRLAHDYTITSTLLNHFQIAGNTFRKDSYSPNVGGNWKDKICMKNVVDCNVNFPTLNFTEFTSWGGAADNGTEQPGWGIKNDLSYVRGKHTLKFGYEFQDQRANGFGQQDISGRADFSFLSTGVPNVSSATSGSSFASFLLGDAILGRTETIRFVTQHYRYHGLYAQDDWRVNNKLTVNFGLRYDLTMPPVSGSDEYSDFTPDRPNPAANGRLGALRFAGFGDGRENTRALVPGWYGGFGPRLGMSYSLNDKTVIRAGAGRSFSRVTAVQGSGHFAGFIGQYQFTNTTNGVQPTFKLDEGLPAYKLPPQLDPSFSNGNTIDWWQGQEAVRAPENLFWTFSMQRQLSSNTVIEAIYNANVGTHLQTGLINVNQTPTAYLNSFIQQYGPTQALNLLVANVTSATAKAANIGLPYASFTGTVNQSLRPYPQYQQIVTGVQNGDKSGHSSYHAFVLKADRRFSKGLTFQWSYTFSKLLTDSDTYFANGASAMDQYNRSLEKSIGQYDQTHALKLNTIYEIPLFKKNRFLGGWHIAAIQNYATGFPLALSRNNSLSALFNGANRPIVDSYENWRAATAGAAFDPNVDKFYKAKALFPLQNAWQFGNATRYNPKLRAFPFRNENVSLSKTFRITEALGLDLRGEAFNIFNRTVFGNPNGNLDSNAFGTVNSQANDPRQMQVALKLRW